MVNEIEELKKVKIEQETKLGAMVEVIKKSTETVTALEDAIKVLNSEKKELSRTIQENEKKIISTEGKTKQIEEKLLGKDENLKSLQSSIKEKDQELSTLRKELSESVTKETVSKLQAKLDLLTVENEKLKAAAASTIVPSPQPTIPQTAVSSQPSVNAAPLMHQTGFPGHSYGPGLMFDTNSQQFIYPHSAHQLHQFYPNNNNRANATLPSLPIANTPSSPLNTDNLSSALIQILNNNQQQPRLDGVGNDPVSALALQLLSAVSMASQQQQLSMSTPSNIVNSGSKSGEIMKHVSRAQGSTSFASNLAEEKNASSPKSLRKKKSSSSQYPLHINSSDDELEQRRERGRRPSANSSDSVSGNSFDDDSHNDQKSENLMDSKKLFKALQKKLQDQEKGITKKFEREIAAMNSNLLTTQQQAQQAQAQAFAAASAAAQHQQQQPYGMYMQQSTQPQQTPQYQYPPYAANAFPYMTGNPQQQYGYPPATPGVGGVQQSQPHPNSSNNTQYALNYDAMQQQQQQHSAYPGYPASQMAATSQTYMGYTPSSGHAPVNNMIPQTLNNQVQKSARTEMVLTAKLEAERDAALKLFQAFNENKQASAANPTMQ